MPNSTSTTESSASEAIKSAQQFHNRVFQVYVVVLIIAAGLTWAAWKSGKSAQDAIQANADARIEETKAVAAAANERAANLENANLILRSDVNAQTAKVAGLEKDAADAKAAQQRVEIDLAKQQEKTAKAELEVATLKVAIQPRRLTPEQRTALVKLLSGEPKGMIAVRYPAADFEATAFAHQIIGALQEAGWNLGSVTGMVGSDPVGLGIVVRSVATVPPYVGRLQRAFFSIGIPMGGVEEPRLEEGGVQLVIGHKPTPENLGSH